MSRYLVVGAALAAIAAVLLGFPSCSDAEPKPPKEKDWSSLIDQERAFADLKRYVELGPASHLPKYDANLTAARDFIKSSLREAGVSDLSKSDTWVQLSGDDRRVRMENIVGTLPGKRPEAILLGAHYDIKILDQYPEFQGANDGASGVALVLELARQLAERAKTEPLEYTYRFAFLDGEEAFVDWYGSNKNLEPDNTYGSRRMAGSLAEGEVAAVIILDLVADEFLQFEREGHSTPEILELFETAGIEAFGVTPFAPRTREMSDDHLPFLAAGIPAIDLIDFTYGPNNKYWHTNGDRLEHVSARSLAKSGTLVLSALPALEAWLSSRPK
ncbi:MAG: M28 family peptidase [Planctomycetota bacterium]